MTSEIDLLKQENARLMARIKELEQIAKEKNELEVRIVELERSAKENIELRSRVAKLEQNQNNTVDRLENSDNSSEKDVNLPDPVINKYIDRASSADTNSKSLGDGYSCI